MGINKEYKKHNGITGKLVLILKKYSLYFGILITTFILKETYPFSFYPMYNNFPNWSYTFYFEDENNKLIKHALFVQHSSLSHLFYSECQKQGIAYGYGMETREELKSVGLKVTQYAFNMNRIKTDSTKQLKLYRIYNHIEDDKIKSDTLLISTTYVIY